MATIYWLHLVIKPINTRINYIIMVSNKGQWNIIRYRFKTKFNNGTYEYWLSQVVRYCSGYDIYFSFNNWNNLTILTGQWTISV